MKEKKIELFEAATTAEIEELCSNLKSVDNTVSANIKWVKAILLEHPKI